MNRIAALSAALALSSVLGACATTGSGANAPAAVPNAEARAAAARLDVLGQMTFWAAEYMTFPQDVGAARGFSEALRQGGRLDRAAQVAREGLQRHPNDPALLRTFGLAQIAAGSPQEALRPLALLAQADAQDWRARSSLGVALDQLGRHDQARQAYREALAIRADDAATLTNLGVSHLMTGEAADAEAILRQAAALPGAPAEARQNLAIALGLQGKFEEADQLARVDLPPATAAANVAYLRGLFSDPRSWDDLRRTLRN